MKRLPLSMVLAFSLGVAACNPPPTTVEQFNADNAVRAKACNDKGYKLGSKDNATCVSLAVEADRQSQQNGNNVAIGVLGAVISDSRAKRDIALLKHLDNGLDLYRFRYRTGDETWVGVIAQQVATVRPDAVSRGADGFFRVDYSKLVLKPMLLADWRAQQELTAVR